MIHPLQNAERMRGDRIRNNGAQIKALAPCTITTRMFNERSTATSVRMFAKFSSVTIAPSTLNTKTFSRKRGMY